MADVAYDADGITIYRGDCADVLPGLDPADVGLLLTDPPYGIDLQTDYGNGWHENGLTYAPIAGDDRPFDPAPLLRYPRVFLFGANHYHSALPPGGSWFVWDKVTRNGIARRAADGELAWTNAGGHPVVIYRHMWSGAYRASERRTFLHPTQKPVSLMRWIVDRWTEPGDLVVDPYMGSGPVAQACADLGRRYVGVELVDDYVAAAVARLDQQTLDLGAYR